MRTKTAFTGVLVAMLGLIVILPPATPGQKVDIAQSSRAEVTTGITAKYIIERRERLHDARASRLADREQRAKDLEKARSERIAAREAEKARKAAEKRKAEEAARASRYATQKPEAPSKNSSAPSGNRPVGSWLALAKCESGANLRANTGNGYLGAYQFLPSTWDGFTHGKFGPVLEASWEEQTYVAYRVWLKQGWTSGFPGCGKKLGYPTMPAVPHP
jgi:hypothetical protein